MKKTIIWGLYDDAKGSYQAALRAYFDANSYEIHSVGINDLTLQNDDSHFYHKIDLGLHNFNLWKELEALPKPDIILASPPCESWSTADCAGRMVRGFNNDLYEMKHKEYYDTYNLSCNPQKKRSFLQKESSRIMGESTIGATIAIIQKFNPKAWVIENPRGSKSWEFQSKHWNFDGFLNLAYYYNYDPSFSKKPTFFKSNLQLDLRSKTITQTSKHMSHGSYAQRSMIPLTLVRDILVQLSNQCNLSLKDAEA